MSVKRVQANEIPGVAQVLEDSFATTVFYQTILKHGHNVTFGTDYAVIKGKSTVMVDRIHDYNAGAEVFQAGDFGAAAVWLRPGQMSPSLRRQTELNKQYKQAMEEIEKRHGFKDIKTYHLSLTGRDPKCTTRGLAVQLIRPLLEARGDAAYVTLEAVDENARQAYEHLGFKATEEAYIGKRLVNAKGLPDANGEGLPLYYMLYK